MDSITLNDGTVITKGTDGVWRDPLGHCYSDANGGRWGVIDCLAAQPAKINIPGANPGVGSGIPSVPSGYLGPSLWQITLALITLYFVMVYVPYGREVGFIVLLGAVLSTKDAIRAFQGLVSFVQTGQ